MIQMQPFSNGIKIYDIMTEATDNPELPLQTLVTFCFIAMRHPNEVSQGEIEQELQFSQTSASRNVRYLAKGVPRSDSNAVMGGYKLIEVNEDPFYRKRKLCKLTAKGIKVAEAITKVYMQSVATLKTPAHA